MLRMPRLNVHHATYFNYNKMKKIFTHSRFGLLAAIALFTTSCEKEKLADVLSDEAFSPINISVPTKMEIGTNSTFTLTGNEITVPVTVEFSSATTRAFSINLAANVDTIPTLVTAGTLATGTVPLQNGTFSIPTVVNVPIGVTSATFNLVVSRSFLEQKYGKSIAVAVKLSSPGKGNTISQGKSAAVVVIKTAEAIAAGDVHYVAFAGTSSAGQYSLPTSADLIGINTKTYVLGSQDMTFNIPLTLSGVAGSAFTVDVVAFPDTVTALIGNGTLKNTKLLASSEYTISTPKVTFDNNKNTATVTISNKINSLLPVRGQKFAIGLKIQNPTRFQVSTTAAAKNIVVVFDGDYFRPYNGKPFLISGQIGVPSAMIPAAQYDFGGEGVAYHDDNNKDGTDFRAPDKVDVGDYTPRSVVGWTNDNEWLTYTVNVEADGEYELNSIIGAPGTDGRFSVFFDDVMITPGIQSSAQTPGQYGDQQPNYCTVKLTKGKHVMKFFENRGAYDVRGWIFTRKK